MLLTLDHCGISITIRLDYCTISILGLSELPSSVRSYLGAWRDCGASRHHYHSSVGPGYYCRWGVREKCKNWPIELEMSGDFFASGKDLDFVLNEIYAAGGSVRPSRLDLCTDYYGPIDPFTLHSVRGQMPKGHDYWDGKKWTGFKRGTLPGRVYEIYDKAWEQVEERRKKLPPGVTDWFRYEYRLGSEYLHKFFEGPSTGLTCHDLSWLMIGWSGDSTSFRCGFFTDLHADLRAGRLPCKETVTLTFDGAFNVLCDDIFSKLNNFRKRFQHLRSVSNGELFEAVLGQVLSDPSKNMGTCV